MKLSVVLATFNEEHTLSDCLESVRDICDEIVIVDGTSTDKTVEIAKKYGAKIYITDNPPIFHINKQKAIDHAQGDWILQLDADEQVSPDLKNEIRQAMHQSKYAGYWIPRKNYFLGRYLMKGGVYPDFTLRLYQRGKGKLPQKDVHEQAVVEGKVGYLKAPLLHQADPTFSRYLLRFDRYTTLMAIQLKQTSPKGVGAFITYLFLKPIGWFFWTYVRHKGFLDSWQGLVFSFFSALRFPVAYLKFLIIL